MPPPRMTEDEMPDDITCEAIYPFPPQRVWPVLTSGEALSLWLMETDLGEAKAGGRFTFRDRPRPFWDGICACEVLEADAPKSFVLAWGTNQKGPPSRVSWTLTPTREGGTHVAFRHGGLTGFMGLMMKLGMSKGWRQMLERSIPFVVEARGRGEKLTREQVKSEMRRK